MLGRARAVAGRLRRRPAIVALAAALACSGCGLGPGPGASDVTLTVTRDFGSIPVATVTRRHVPGSETVMRMLERYFRLSTRYGGGFVESIDGLGPSGPMRDWFYYVNGVQAPEGAASTTVHAGDHIWWDLHDWRATESIPAVVGSFPEPFTTGIGGRRYPVTIECGSGVSAACRTVTAVLSAARVPSGPQVLGTGSGTSTITVVVGTWTQIRAEVVAQLIARGPGASGVYARFAHQGSELDLLDPAGDVAGTLGAGAGLIAATAGPSGVPTWVVTGTDPAGVLDAARSFNARALHDHFALAVDGRRMLPVPLDPAR
ncbi:MAG TPA: DUF4430 domain-containing protein [Solirubrobacteraceae bacterium]|nr:DUF4430 domain-containing protein [Solirubrobacteraceae bacterium]